VTVRAQPVVPGPRRRGGRVRGAAASAAAGALALAACRPLPPLARAPDAERSALAARCQRAFPVGPWEAVHVVEASLPLHNQTALLGAISAAAPGLGFRSVLMAQEGLVLFDASYRSRAVEVHRALPPFDHEGFGEGTVDDIRLLLFPAEGELAEVGYAAGPLPACRWVEGDGGVVETAFPAADRLRIRRYDARGRLVRSAEARGLDGCGFAQQIELEAPGAAGYRLRLSLVERTAPRCPSPGRAETAE